MNDCSCRLVYGYIEPRLGPPQPGPRGRVRDPMCPVHGALRCACCGKSDSKEGFLRVTMGTCDDGVALRPGDTIRVECARARGIEVPEPTHPTLTFRAR